MSRAAFLFLIVHLASCATTSSAADEEAPAAGAFHAMQPGETISDLARESGLSVAEIVEVNGLANAEDVAVGQVIFLPAGAGAVLSAPTAPTLPQGSQRNAPFVWPVDGVVLRAFSTGSTKRAPYEGLLIAAPADTPVVAAAAGEVMFTGDQGTDFGTLVIVKHQNDFVSVYGHLERVLVKPGERVTAGQRLASVGTSGRQETPRLHFQVRQGRATVDPISLLPVED